MADNTQLDINQQINKLLSDRVTIMKNAENSLSNQVTLATALCSALECESLDELEKRLKTVRDSLKGVSDTSRDFTRDIEDGSERASNKTKTLSEALKELKDDFVKLNPVTAAAAAGMAAGFVRGVGSAWESIKSLTSGLFDLIKTMGNLALTILSIPFKILEGLFDLAQSGGGGPSPIKVELENIRKEFGSLATNEGRAVAGTLKDIRSEYSNVAKSGLSIRKIFGPGLDGMAKALAENRELAKALGNSLTSLRDVIGENSNALMIYRKGMGLTAEQEGFIIKNSAFLGKKPMEVMRQFASMSIRMGKQFGINAKLISRSMAEMASDPAHFASLGPKVLGSVATYAHKLGIEIKDLAGIMDAFDDFESGAVAASKLAQSLQMNVNSLDLLDTDDAAQRVEYLRQKFRESGNTYENLSRQQKKYLQTTANITDQLAAAAFGQGNINKSYKEFQQASEKAEKSAMTQEQAMKRLADSIERVFGSGGGGKFKSFFDAFTSGFASGIMRSRQFRQAMRALRYSIRAVFLAGRRVGRLFVDLFPGVKKFFTGLRDIFDPRKFRGLMRGVVDAFRDLFKTLKTDPKAGVEKFLKTFRELFKNFFIKSGPAAKSIMDGAKEFLKTLYAIFQTIFPMVLDALAKAAEMITSFLSNPPDMKSPITKSFNRLIDALVPMFVMIGEKLGPPFVKMFKVMWETAKPYVVKWALLMVGVGFAKIMLNVLGGAFMGALGGAMAKLGTVAMEKFLIRLGKLPDPSKITPGGGPPTPPPPVTTTPGSPPVPPAAAAAARTWIGQALILVISLAALAAFAIFMIRTFNVTQEEIQSVALLMVSMAASAAMIMLAANSIPPGASLASIGVQLALIGGIMVAVGGVSAAVLWALSEIPKDVSFERLISFVAVVTTLTLATIPLIAAATIIGLMGKAAAAAVAGMVVVALFMGAIGFVGVEIVESLAGLNIPDPAGLALIMGGLAQILLATVPLIGAAVFIGAMAFGGILGGVAIGVVIAGLAGIGLFVRHLVKSLIPAIVELAAVNVPNPESFRVVVDALRTVADVTGTLIKSMSLLSFVLSRGDTSAADLRLNLTTVGSLVSTILDSGIMKIMQELMNFAKYANVKQGTGEIISAIGSVLGAAAQLASAFAPNSEALKAIVAISTSFLSEEEDVGKMIGHIERMMPMMRQTMLVVIPELGRLIGSIVSSLSGISVSEDVKNIGPVISAMGSIFTAIATLVNALSPSDAAWKAMSDALTNPFALAGNQQAVYDLFVVDMKRRLNNMVPIMKNLKTQTIELIKGIKGPIVEIASAMSGMNTENLKTVIPLVTTVLEFSSGLISNIGPALEAANKASEKSKFGEQTNNFRAALGSIMWAMKELGPVFQSLAEPMKNMINGVIEVAKGITNSRGLKAKIEIVTAAVQAVGALSSIFGKGGEFGSVGESGFMITETIISGMAETMRLVTEILLRADGPLVAMANQLSSINFGDTRKIKKNSEAIKQISEGVGMIAEAFARGSGIEQFGFTTFGAGSGNFIENLYTKINLFTTGQGRSLFTDLKKVVDNIPGKVQDKSESITSIGANLKTLASTFSSGNLGLSESDMLGLEQGMASFGKMKTLIDQIPIGIANRSQSITNMAETLSAISTALGNVGLAEDELSAYVQLNNALKGSGKLTIEHKNLNISLNVHVQMSAEQIAQGIIKVNDIIPGGKKQKFAIDET